MKRSPQKENTTLARDGEIHSIGLTKDNKYIYTITDGKGINRFVGHTKDISSALARYQKKFPNESFTLAYSIYNDEDINEKTANHIILSDPTDNLTLPKNDIWHSLNNFILKNTILKGKKCLFKKALKSVGAIPVKTTYIETIYYRVEELNNALMSFKKCLNKTID